MTKEEYRELQNRMSEWLEMEKFFLNPSGKYFSGLETAVYAMKSILHDYYKHQEGEK